MQSYIENIAKNQKDVLGLLLAKLSMIDAYHLCLVSRALKNGVYQKVFANKLFLTSYFPRLPVTVIFDQTQGAKNSHILLQKAIELQEQEIRDLDSGKNLLTDTSDLFKEILSISGPAIQNFTQAIVLYEKRELLLNRLDNSLSFRKNNVGTRSSVAKFVKGALNNRPLRQSFLLIQQPMNYFYFTLFIDNLLPQGTLRNSLKLIAAFFVLIVFIYLARSLAVEVNKNVVSNETTPAGKLKRYTYKPRPAVNSYFASSDVKTLLAGYSTAIKSSSSVVSCFNTATALLDYPKECQPPENIPRQNCIRLEEVKPHLMLAPQKPKITDMTKPDPYHPWALSKLYHS